MLIGVATLVSRLRVEPTQDELPLENPFTLPVDAPIPVEVRRRD